MEMFQIQIHQRGTLCNTSSILDLIQTYQAVQSGTQSWDETSLWLTSRFTSRKHTIVHKICTYQIAYNKIVCTCKCGQTRASMLNPKKNI